MNTGRQGKCELVMRCFSVMWLAAISATQPLWVPRQDPGVRRGSAAGEGVLVLAHKPSKCDSHLGLSPTRSLLALPALPYPNLRNARREVCA